jgi:hypothetical protein
MSNHQQAHSGSTIIISHIIYILEITLQSLHLLMRKTNVVD